jgi:hypothetical protein
MGDEEGDDDVDNGGGSDWSSLVFPVARFCFGPKKGDNSDGSQRAFFIAARDCISSKRSRVENSNSVRLPSRWRRRDGILSALLLVHVVEGGGHAEPSGKERAARNIIADDDAHDDKMMMACATRTINILRSRRLTRRCAPAARRIVGLLLLTVRRRRYFSESPSVIQK